MHRFCCCCCWFMTSPQAQMRSVGKHIITTKTKSIPLWWIILVSSARGQICTHVWKRFYESSGHVALWSVWIFVYEEFPTVGNEIPWVVLTHRIPSTSNQSNTWDTWLRWRGEHCMANTADQNRWREVRVRRWNVNREVCENFFDPICKRPVDSQEPDWKCGRTKKKKDPNRHKTSTLAAASRLLGTIWTLDVPENPGGHRTQRHCTEVYIPLTPQTLHLWKCTIKVGLVSCVNNKPCCKVKGACRFLPMQFSASAATPSRLWVFDTVLLIVWIQTFKTA